MPRFLDFFVIAKQQGTLHRIVDCAAAASNADRRSIKNPLIGSAISTLHMSGLSQVTNALIFARLLSQLPTPAAAMYRLPTTRSQRFSRKQVKHLRQDLFVVLQVGIYHRHVWRAGSQNTFHAGGRADQSA
jgi:hypothetical protein